MRSAVAGAVYFTKYLAGAGAGCDKSCVRKADADAECGEFIVRLKHINRLRSSVVFAHFESC